MKIKALFKRKKAYRSAYGLPPIGSFALPPKSGKPLRWEHCREHFALNFLESTSGFFFSHPRLKGEDVANFIGKIEYVVQLNHEVENAQQSVFRKTDNEHILWIEPAEFWKSCKIKRSLFTILVRCGKNYVTDQDNFDDVLFGVHKENVYIKDTKLAFLRFMFGFTSWQNDSEREQSLFDEKHGWKEEFSISDRKKIKSKLLAPKIKNKYSILFESDFLWC